MRKVSKGGDLAHALDRSVQDLLGWLERGQSVQGELLEAA